MPLLTRIERYMHLTRMSASAFGRTVTGDPRLVFDLRRGRRIGAEMVSRIEAYLAAQEKMLRGAPCRTR